MAENGLFQAKLTYIIHEEWIRNLLAKRPDLKRDSLERARDLMLVAIRDCLVTDFEVHMNDFRLPDSNDHHVLAAAIKSKAEIILTFNLGDFPNRILKQYSKPNILMILSAD